MNQYRLTAACLLAALAMGCSAPLKQSGPAGVAEMNLPDKEAAIASFEQNWVETQFQAARERLTRGELGLAEQDLRRVLALRPSHLAAQRLLADVLVAGERLAEAEALLTELVARQPNDPAAHHALGLLLSELDRREEAMRALARAVELAPDDQLYRLSLDALAATNSSGPPATGIEEP